MDEIKIFEDCTGFDWDMGNSEKNWHKHQVHKLECEQVFFNKPLLVLEDIRHSEKESRNHALGITDMGRKLFMVFTIRKNLIRIISARDMNKKECEIYEKT